MIEGVIDSIVVTILAGWDYIRCAIPIEVVGFCAIGDAIVV
jgi:hypothetical protein